MSKPITKGVSAEKVAPPDKPRSATTKGPKNDFSGKPAKEVKLRAEGAVHSYSGLYDCCALLVHCAKHDKILLARHEHTTWMPFSQMSTKRSWKHGAMWALCVTLAGGVSSGARFDALKHNLPVQLHKCLQVMRVQLPQTQKFFTRAINYIKLDDKGDFKCCQSDYPHLQWLPLQEIRMGKMTNMWGPELSQFAQLIPESQSNKIAPTEVTEFSLEEAFMLVPRDPPRNQEEQLLLSLRITEKDIERLYADFLEHCFPSLYQTVDSFKCYMAKYECEKDDTRLGRLFAAFNFSDSGYLSFHELLLGLACMESNSQHGEFRVKFIFRYYDTNNSNSLTVDEIKVMLTDMGVPTSQTEEKLKEMLASTEASTVNGRQEVSAKQLISAIGKHKFRGTHLLCRSGKSIFTQICRSICQKCFRHRTASKTMLSNLVRSGLAETCSTCMKKRYDLASHQLKFSLKGPERGDRLVQVELDKTRQYSVDCVFNPSSVANVTLKLIREFVKVKGTVEQPFGLMQDRKDLFWKLLLTLYSAVDLILDQEFKCQKVTSPCFIIGDVHGNLEDLLSLERTLWREAPAMSANFVFLGDYVDRGQWGLECAIYLVAFKLLCPNRVILLRGNHEVRELQTHYTYKKECVVKYGELQGLKVWELTNRIFDKLPVCALVDESIFCAHGGIPRSAQQVDQIVALERILVDPQEESTIAWEILWSDPCPIGQFIDICEQRGLDPDAQAGYVYNVKRGTAFLFSEVGATSFLRNNYLTHIVRAHEVAPPGYVFHFGSKCVTIFSCSHYCGHENQCGFVLASDQRLRVIVLDTTNNTAATD